MYCGVYAPWDHYPKFLRQSEVRNPFISLKGFFDTNDVEGHFEKLKRWRHFVVNFEHYNDERFGPGNLLYDYELNIRLLECLYLLFLDYQEHRYILTKIEEEQLASEKEEWTWYPSDLTKEELLNPYLVIKTAFDEIQPEQFRDHLWEWINAALSSNAIDETTTPGEIITVYEHIKKMYSAAWLIFQRETAKPYLKKIAETNTESDVQVVDDQGAVISNEGDGISVEGTSSKSISSEEMALKEVVNHITKTTPSVQLITHLGTQREPFIFFLFIIVDHSEMRGKEKIAKTIEDNCSKLVSVVAIVKKLRGVRKQIELGSRFIGSALWNKTILYRSSSLKLPKQQLEIPRRMSGAEIFDVWEDYGSFGHSLSHSAAKYQREKNYSHALLIVDQAIEYMLKATIKLNTAYEPQTIDIERLLKMTLLFTNRYWDMFHRDSESSIRAFGLLTTGFGNWRKETTEPIDEAAINVLILNAEILAIRLEDEYHYLMTETSEV
jgi:hypothetical protein